MTITGIELLPKLWAIVPKNWIPISFVTDGLSRVNRITLALGVDGILHYEVYAIGFPVQEHAGLLHWSGSVKVDMAFQERLCVVLGIQLNRIYQVAIDCPSHDPVTVSVQQFGTRELIDMNWSFQLSMLESGIPGALPEPEFMRHMENRELPAPHVPHGQVTSDDFPEGYNERSEYPTRPARSEHEEYEA